MAPAKKFIVLCLGREVKKGKRREREENPLKCIDNTLDRWNKQAENLCKNFALKNLMFTHLIKLTMN